MSSNGSTISIGAPVQTNQTIAMTGTGNTTMSTAGSFDARSMVVSGGGIISVGISSNTLHISATGGGGGGGGVAMSAGTQSVSTGTVIFSNANNISFGMAASKTLTASYSQSNQTQNWYAPGNTVTAGGASSTAGVNAASVSLSGMGALSVGYTNGAVQLSAPATSSLVGGNGITVSTAGSTISINGPAASSLSAVSPIQIATGGSTISIGANIGTISNWEPMPINYTPLTTKAIGNGSISFFKLMPEGYVSATQLQILMSMSASTSSNSSYAGGISIAAGIFVSTTGSILTLNTQSSGSYTFQYTNTSNNSNASLHGVKGITMPMSFSASPGNYWLGIWAKTTFTNVGWLQASFLAPTANNFSYAGLLGGASTASSAGPVEGVGMYVSTAATLISSANMASISQQVVSAYAMPHVVFKNITW
jgi:hypothetical protein